MKFVPCLISIYQFRRSGFRVQLFVVLQIIACICVYHDAWGFVPNNGTLKRPTKSNAKTFSKAGTAIPLMNAIHVLKTQNLITNFQTEMWKCTSYPTTSALFGMWSQNDEIEGSDRFKACIPYLLPLIDGDHFGQYMYERIQLMRSIDQLTIGPLAELSHSIPFLSLGLFIALTLGTRFNTAMSRNLRFSAQQAALIDVALLIPELIGSSFVEDPLPRYIVEPCCNFVWYAYMSIVVYCLISNLRGKKPDQIPYLSYSADIMVGPF
jgi:Chloroplast import apparatus Tic20-like